MLGNATQVTLSGKQRRLDWRPGQRDSEGQLLLFSAIWLGLSVPWSPTAAPAFLAFHNLVTHHTSAGLLATWYLERDGGFA